MGRFLRGTSDISLSAARANRRGEPRKTSEERKEHKRRRKVGFKLRLIERGGKGLRSW